MHSTNQKTRTDGGTGHYQTETLRPIVSLVYVLPFLLTYELGAVFLDNQSIRNGLDIWLSGVLNLLGAGELLLLPLITTFVLFGMHHFKQDHWSFRPTVLAGMLVESFALALIVWWAARAQHLFLLELSDPLADPLSISLSIPPAIRMLIAGDATGSGLEINWAPLVSFCGAGLYEELVFRLLMLPGLIWILILAGVRKVPAAAIAIIITSVLFAGVHYEFLNPAGIPFEWPGFMARIVASVFFALVFLFRGFGVAVGTHVAYDILTLL